MAGFSVPVARVFYQGQVAAGAKIHVYQSGTTTPVTVYADAGLSTPTTNPVVCDSNGEAVFYVTTDYALRLYCTTAGGTLVRDIDPVYPVQPLTGPLTHGQCRLVKSGSNLALAPFNGNKLVINGTAQTVTSPTLAPSGLASNTAYFVYAFMSGNVMTLEASTTAHATDAATGVEVKSGDETRTLVGLAATNGSTAWEDAAANRLVASYFNRRPRHAEGNFTTNRTTTSTTLVEVHAEIRASFVCWGDTALCQYSGAATNSSGGNATYTRLGLDGTGTAFGGTVFNAADPGNFLNNSFAAAVTPPEGKHYVTLLGKADNPTTATYAGAGEGTNHISVTVLI